MSVFVVLASFGFNVSILKLCSEDRSEKQKNYLFRKGLTYSLVSQILTIALIFFLVYFELLSQDFIINKVFLVYALGLAPLVLDGIILAYLQSMKRIKEYANVQIISKPISIVTIVIFTYYLGLFGYAIGIAMSYFFTLLLLFYRNKNFILGQFELVENPFEAHSYYALYSTLTNFVGIVLISIDIFFLNYFLSDRVELGFYSFATIFIGMLGVVTRSILQISHPHFSEKASDYSKWITSFRKYQKLMNIVLIVMFGVSSVLVPIFMYFVFDGRYMNSIQFFLILGIAWLFRDLSAFRGSALFGLGKLKLNFVTNISSLIFHLGFIYFGFQIMGIYGVAIGMILGACSTYFLSLIVFRSVLRQIRL